MPATPTRSTSPDDGPERSQRLFLVLVALGAVSAVIAGVVIFSGGEIRAPKDPVAPLQVAGESLLVGRPGAPTKVAVFDDFGDRASRDFEIASRDFLLVEAAQGHVQVDYHDVPPTGGFGVQALQAWAAVAEHATVQQAAAYRNALFDHQPEAGADPTADDLEAWAVRVGVHQGVVIDALKQSDPTPVGAARSAARAAGIRLAPAILVDGKPFGSGTGTQLADQLQRRILEGSRWKSSASNAG